MANTPMTPDQITAKQIRNTSGAVQAYKDGVNRVTTAPGQLAAAKQSKYLAGVQNNVNKWAANVAKVTLQQWQNSAITKGADRLSTGITAAQPKILAFWQKFQPYQQQAAAAVRQMPNDTYEQRKARANAMMDAAHQFTNA